MVEYLADSYRSFDFESSYKDFKRREDSCLRGLKIVECQDSVQVNNSKAADEREITALTYVHCRSFAFRKHQFY